MFIHPSALLRRARMAPGIAALLLATSFHAGISQAATSAIPATRYPAGAHITYRPALSNHQMDCMWNFFCEGSTPLFHFQSQTQLQRTGGWGQFAGLHRHGRMLMAFELFASTYRAGDEVDGTPFSKGAFEDLMGAIEAQGYGRISHGSRLLPAAATGGSITAVHNLGSSELVVMACWSGTREIEAIAMVDSRSTTLRRTALYDLTSQVRWAADAG